MSQVSILRRSEEVRFPEPMKTEEVAAVTYATAAVPPRIVYLPRGSYRPATPEELVANPHYQLLPINEQALQLEKKAIEQDLQRVLTATHEHYEL